jgi:4-hydroxybenzoate polyprenyltransferase
MRRLALKLITAIQLTRLTMAFGAVSDVWFVILYTRSRDEYVHVPVNTMDPVGAALLAGAVVAVGLFAYGAALNDVLDVRHDAAFSPERPIPAGRIRVGQAIVVTVGALMVAVLAAHQLGTWSLWITLITAAAILFYNAAGKFIPAVGVVTLGLIHAAHMLIPNHELTLMLPVWLVMTHAMVIAMAVHRLEDKRPRLNRTSVTGIVFGWITWSALLLGASLVQAGRLWPEELSLLNLVIPLAAVVGFLPIVRWKTVGVGPRVAAEKLKRYGAMWQSLYGAAWLWALGLGREALWIGAFALTGFAAMTLIKEVTGMSGRPITYR